MVRSRYSAVIRGQGGSGGQAVSMGLLLGMAMDTAIKGAFSTMELSWQQGPAPSLLIVLLLAVYAYLARRALTGGVSAAGWDGGRLGWMPLAALGPILFLELLLFQNLGQQTALIGWDQPLIFLWIMAGNCLGMFAAAVFLRHVRGGPEALAALAGLFALAVVGELSGIAAALASMFGLVALALAVAAVGAAVGRGVGDVPEIGPGPAAGSAVVAWVLGMIVLLVLTFLYYASYVLDIPGGSLVILPAVAVLFVCTAAALPALRGGRSSSPLGLPVALAGLVLLRVPAGYWASWREAKPSGEAAFPVRVMSYNLHQGFDQDGRMTIRELAAVIEAEKPGIVALQEVSRGWVIDGSFDMLPWLSRKLDMPYVWAPAADSVFGNAILSKYPIAGSSVHPMPNNSDISMDRGYATAVISMDDSTQLAVLATHLHQVEDEGHLRVPQVVALLNAWGGRERTVLLGDLNARPSDPEIVLLEEAGLVDAFAASPQYDGRGYTSTARDPRKRIDYVWVSPDLRPSDFSVSGGTASDHRQWP